MFAETVLPKLSTPEFKTPGLSDLEAAEKIRYLKKGDVSAESPLSVRVLEAAADGNERAVFEILSEAHVKSHGSPIPQLDLLLALPEVVEKLHQQDSIRTTEIKEHVEKYLGYGGGILDPKLRYVLAMIGLAQGEKPKDPIASFKQVSLEQWNLNDTYNYLTKLSYSLATVDPARSALCAGTLMYELSRSGSLSHDMEEKLHSEFMPRELGLLVEGGHVERAQRLISYYFILVSNALVAQEQGLEKRNSLGIQKLIGYIADGGFTSRIESAELVECCIDHLVALTKAGINYPGSKEPIEVIGPLVGIADAYRGARGHELGGRAIREADARLTAKYSSDAVGGDNPDSFARRAIPKGLAERVKKILEQYK